MIIDTQDMRGQLEAGLYNYKPSFEKPLLPELRPDDRWICASALQKAIRRGQAAEAYRAALCLQQLNPGQLWSRLRTIAAEDIGVADFQAVYETLFVSGKSQWRKEHGGEELVLSYITERLCRAEKTRSADDLLYIADAHPDFSEAREQLSGMTADELYSAILDDGRSLYEQVIAGWYLAGTAHHRPVNVVRKKGDPSRLLDIFMHIGMPDYATNTIREGLSRTEGHAIAMGFAYMAVATSKHYSLVTECQGPSKRVGDFCTEAFDRHTRPGKAAFRKFLELCPEALNFIKANLPSENPVNVIGWCVFALEGQVLDRRIIFDGSEKIREMALEAWLHSRYMNPRVREELLRIVKERMDRLHEARCLIWDSMATLPLEYKG